jgi:4-amino-4-deoxy-L-arabinose transferase-like glycosyltransferase
MAGAVSLALTFLIGTWLFSRWVGLAGALILGTTYEFWWLAGRAQVDMVLSACVLAALAGFVASERFPRWRAAGLAVLYGASALGFLAKGILGAGLPGLAVVAWLLWERRSLRGHWGHLAAGALFLLLVIAGWGLVLARHGGEAMLSEYFLKQHLGRFSGGEDHQEAFYYYLWAFPMAFLPWTLLWPASLAGWRGVFEGSGRGEREESRGARLLAAWFLSGFIVFSVASTKRETYLLPIFAPAALLVAMGLEQAWNRLAVRRMLRENAITFGFFGAALVTALAGIAVAWRVLRWMPDAVALGALLGVRGPGLAAWPRRWRRRTSFPITAPAFTPSLGPCPCRSPR